MNRLFPMLCIFLFNQNSSTFCETPIFHAHQIESVFAASLCHMGGKMSLFVTSFIKLCKLSCFNLQSQFHVCYFLLCTYAVKHKIMLAFFLDTYLYYILSVYLWPISSKNAGPFFVSSILGSLRAKKNLDSALTYPSIVL